jgi:hypothetical protein
MFLFVSFLCILFQPFFISIVSIVFNIVMIIKIITIIILTPAFPFTPLKIYTRTLII